MRRERPFTLMPRLGWIIPVLLLAGGIAASGVIAGSDLEKPGVVRVTAREVSRSSSDIGELGNSTGDIVVRAKLLYNTRITQRAIGHEELICTYLGHGAVLGGGSRNCVSTVFLPQGKIVSQGAVHNLLIYEIPVIGGTGIYNNVGGTLTVTFLGGRPTRQFLLFRLTL